MNARTRHLKIKVKNCAEEAHIIRKEEQKTYGMERWNLQHHRKTHLRRITRLNQLAYGFLRGIPYSAMESKTATDPSWEAVEGIAMRFGGDPEEFGLWLSEAKSPL
jgi:hypothetical protein